MRVVLSVTLAVALFGAGRAPAAEAPTFNKDVAPILFAHCATCHHAGSIGPFPLLIYQDAKKRAEQLARVTDKRIMPPWMPHPEWATFKDARTLTAEQIAVFQKWADAGTPEGDAKDLPPQPKFKEGWQLGKPDLILKVDKPFTIPAEGRDVYHHFVFPLDLPKDRYLKGIEVIPGNRRVAHHAVGILDTSGTAVKLAKKHDGISYPGNTPGFLPAGFTPGYAPGQKGGFFGPDEAITLKKGTDLVLQMHYSPSGKEETDQTQIGLYFTDTPPKRNVGILLMGSLDIDIAPGEKAYKRTDSFTIPVDYEVRSAWAHMHLIGKEVKMWAELPDKKTVKLLWISDWNFNWQDTQADRKLGLPSKIVHPGFDTPMQNALVFSICTKSGLNAERPQEQLPISLQDTYVYDKPFVLPKGTVVKAEFVWDNSAANPRNPSNPPKRVLNGEQSADEMGGLILGGRPVKPADELTAWLAVIGHYFEVEGKKQKK